MSPLRLTGSTSGYSQLDAPAVAGDQTFTLPGTGGTLDRLNRAGNILQVVSATYSTQVTVTTTTYTDTGLTASITPSSSSSKIFVAIRQAWTVSRTSANYLYGGIRLLRDATVIFTPPADGNGPYNFGFAAATANLASYGDFALTQLDSPATTSSVTYKTQCRPYDTSNSHTFAVNVASSLSTITLIEVAA